MYIIIPIYSDGFLHPLHKDNDLSLLYVKRIGDTTGDIICMSHPDLKETEGNLSWILKDTTSFYLTPNKKQLMHIFPNQRLLDVNLMHWWKHNKPMDFEDIRVNAYDFFYNKYYNVKNVNEIIPVVKHKEYCDMIADKIIEFIHTVYENVYNNDVIDAFYSIEKNGIPISDDICDIFDERVRKHISNGKLYSDYNLWTSTGRPSNSFGNVNFAALTNKQRIGILPQNDYLLEYDYDAYHLRLIGDLINYKFTCKSVHEYLAIQYGVGYNESKSISFRLLYGGITDDIANSIEFFGKTKKFIDKLWNKFNDRNYVKTNIYSRRLSKKNISDMSRNKLFNYLIQAHETETNVQTILKLQEFLLNKKTKLILYGYDSFLFDFSKEDGIEIMSLIKSILERDGHLVKTKMGINYSDMKDITKRL